MVTPIRHVVGREIPIFRVSPFFGSAGSHLGLLVRDGGDWHVERHQSHPERHQGALRSCAPLPPGTKAASLDRSLTAKMSCFGLV